MKRRSNGIYKPLLRWIFPILFAAVSADAGQSVTYACGHQGCQIKNEIQTRILQDDLKAQIVAIIKRPIQSLLNKKINQLSGLPLQKILEDVSSVRFKILSEGYFAPQGRFGGFMYNVEEKTVFGHIETFKEMFSGTGMKTMEGILLHETLGALGYYDDDYQISSTLMALDMLTEPEVTASLVVISKIALNWTKRAISPAGQLRETTGVQTKAILVAGGSTTAGGGGDPLMSLIKTRLIAHALKKQESSEMLNRIINDLRLERPLGYEDFQKNRLKPIRSYPLSYDDFLLSVQSTTDSNRLTLLLGIEGYFAPVLNIEMHLLNYLKKMNLIGFDEEKK